MALIRPIAKSDALTTVDNIEGGFSASTISISANIGDYVVLVSAVQGTTITPPTISGATLIDSDDNAASGSNVRYAYLYKATATTVTATVSSNDRLAMFTLS